MNKRLRTRVSTSTTTTTPPTAKKKKKKKQINAPYAMLSLEGPPLSDESLDALVTKHDDIRMYIFHGNSGDATRAVASVLIGALMDEARKDDIPLEVKAYSEFDGACTIHRSAPTEEAEDGEDGDGEQPAASHTTLVVTRLPPEEWPYLSEKFAAVRITQH